MCNMSYITSAHVNTLMLNSESRHSFNYINHLLTRNTLGNFTTEGHMPVPFYNISSIALRVHVFTREAEWGLGASNNTQNWPFCPGSKSKRLVAQRSMEPSFSLRIFLSYGSVFQSIGFKDRILYLILPGLKSDVGFFFFTRNLYIFFLI